MADDEFTIPNGWTYQPFQTKPLTLGVDYSGLIGPQTSAPEGGTLGVDYSGLTPPTLTQISGAGPALGSVPTYQPGAMGPGVDWGKIASTAITAGATIAGQVIQANTAQGLAQLQATLVAQQQQTQLLLQQGQAAQASAQQAAAQATQIRLAQIQAGSDRAAQASAAQVARTQQLLADKQATQQTIAGVATSVLGGGGGYKAPYAAQNAQALGIPAPQMPTAPSPTPAAPTSSAWKWALGGLALAAVTAGGYKLATR